jgi:hypothetical protein
MDRNLVARSTLKILAVLTLSAALNTMALVIAK